MITAIHRTESVGCLLVTVETECGMTGENYVFALNKSRLDVFDGMIKSLAHHVVGEDPMFVERIWENMWLDINPVGHKGVAISALSAIDTALWDLVGKKANMPLHQVFGACREKVKAYASSGLWLSSNVNQLVDEALGYVDQGFRSVKLRLGKENPDEDVARVAALREALGGGIEILTDANQSLTPRAAIRLAQRIEKYDIGWFEEPVSALDLVGHEQVRNGINIPVASGETDYTRFGMKSILDARAVDVLMPDLQRIGGLSEFRKSVALASAYHIPVSTHIFTEQSLCIAGSAVNCISVEHVSWFSSLFNESIEIADGFALIPTKPGLGFTFDYDFIDQHIMK